MVTIKIGKKKVKVFNLLLLILFFIIFLYALISSVLLLPVFKSKYSYVIEKENYNIKVAATFKRNIFTCNLKEEYKVLVEDKKIKDKLYNDLTNDGFKLKNNVFVRNKKSYSSCKTLKKDYKKYHNDKYVTFKLKGNSNITLDYGSEYKDEYVDAFINKKQIKDININSNLNLNKLGKYIISYSIDINDNYKQRLYRVVNIVDNEKPSIILNGDSNVTLAYGSNYNELGFSANDNYDGDVTNKVMVKQTIDTKKAGTYKVSYKVKDSSGNSTKVERTVVVKEKEVKVIKEEPKIEVIDGITYVDGILLVNKNYSLPKDYDPKVNKEALKQLKLMQADAEVLGLDLSLISGYRSYKTQKDLYENYVKQDGENANTYSAKPGYSEHQTGLAFDIGCVDKSFEKTKEAKWIEENAHLYGFIVRYPKGKTNVTGYIYEPWHVRYLGIDIATKVKKSGLCLEEYLKVN